jgi:abhydrolase domain-containing protein 6
MKLMCRLLLNVLVTFAVLVQGGTAHADAATSCEIATKSERIGSGTIVYNVAGNGPNLLMIHGLFAAKEQWNTLVCVFANSGYTAIAVDLPGYGKSGGFSTSDYRLDRQVDLLHHFTKRLGIARADIAGSSMGGAIASLYTKRYPHAVRSLAFIGSPLGIVGWDRGLRNAIYQGINPFIPIDDQQFDLELGLLFVTPPEIPADRRKVIISDYVARNRHYVQVWNIVNLYDGVLWREPPSQTPTLIVWGEDDRIYNVAGAEQLHRRIPGSELHRMPRAGHLLLMESAEEVTPVYLDFLRSHGGEKRLTSPKITNAIN